jgi:DNA-directed RNA polymerase subunit M/transcription elongation factor TFIIS
MTIRVLKCPSCGYRFRANPEEQYLRGVIEDLVRETTSPHPQAQDKHTVDLTCPNCKQDFEVEVKGVR